MRRSQGEAPRMKGEIPKEEISPGHCSQGPQDFQRSGLFGGNMEPVEDGVEASSHRGGCVDPGDVVCLKANRTRN